jgi:F-type H+-transporting ATPase subunit epsilon
MSKPLGLTVLTPAETLLDAQGVAWVQARLADGGGIGIYPGHAPLLAETITAPLRYADASGEHTLEVEAGILQVDGDGVTVLTSGRAHASEVSQPPEVLEGERFDRLAQELLDSSRGRLMGVLGLGDEQT